MIAFKGRIAPVDMRTLLSIRCMPSQTCRAIGARVAPRLRISCERLAEYGWKPHRVFSAQNNLLRASIYWYMREQQRGTVSSNSRFQTAHSTVFRQPLNLCRRSVGGFPSWSSLRSRTFRAPRLMRHRGGGLEARPAGQPGSAAGKHVRQAARWMAAQCACLLGDIFGGYSSSMPDMW